MNNNKLEVLKENLRKLVKDKQIKNEERAEEALKRIGAKMTNFFHIDNDTHVN